MKKISDRLDKIVQDHPLESLVTVTVIGHTVGFLAGHYLAKGLVKAAANIRIL